MQYVLGFRSTSEDGARFWLSMPHSDVIIPLLIALALRCVMSVFAACVLNSGLLPAEPPSPGLYQGVTLIQARGWYLLFAPFQRWDGIWYQLIAEQGYSTKSLTAFFPLFPLLIRPLMAVASDGTVPAQVISFVSTAIAFVIFYRATARLAGERAAVYSLLAWALFPTSFFFFAPYAESVFVLCSLSSLEAARKSRWWLAGLLGGFAALARSYGLLLVLPLGVQCILAHGIHRMLRHPSTLYSWIRSNLKPFLRDSLAIGLVPLAVCGYMLYLYLAFGDALLWQHALASWGWVLVPPWEPVRATLVAILVGSSDVIANNLSDLITTLIVLIAMVAALIPHVFHRTNVGTHSALASVHSTDNATQVNTVANTEMGPIATLPPIYILYGLVFLIGSLMMMIVTERVQVPLYAEGRRAVILFPAFIIIGAWLKDRRFRLLYMAVSFAVQLVLVSAFAVWFWVD